MGHGLRPVRTAVATVLGCVAGAVAGIAVGDLLILPMVELEGFAEFLPVLWSVIVGSVLGAGIALVVAFRDEPARMRAVTAGLVVVIGLVTVAAAFTGIADIMVVHPVTLVVALPVVALLGRLLAGRTGGA